MSVRARAFIFNDPRSHALLELLDRAAPSNATVMVCGETGTGKELVARYIHQRSDRAFGPFIPVNCGAFSETLIESELFGYEKGAYTGAGTAREGWFEAANGGTLFLDEIGDLPLPLQVKLLRVLQEQEVVRIGARKAVKLNVRLVAATNVDLGKAVAAGRFREDLYYRLNVVAVTLPPLRERRGDILPLSHHFLELYRGRLGLGDISLGDDAVHALISYSWPGNIRELENVIHRALLISDGKLIHPADLQLPLHDDYGTGALTESHGATAQGADWREALRDLLEYCFVRNEPDLFDDLVSEVISFAYSKAEGNQLRTAELLGLSRNVLRTHLRNTGLLNDAGARARQKAAIVG